MTSQPAVLLLSLLLLGGCTSLRDPNAPPAPVEDIGGGSPTTVGPPLPPATEPPALNRESLPEPPPSVVPVPQPAPATAASTLLEAVDAAIAAGELDRAAAICERALRISPRDGHLWYKLATIRFLQGRNMDAEGFAQRALSFAGADAQLVRDSNALLARISAGDQ